MGLWEGWGLGASLAFGPSVILLSILLCLQCFPSGSQDAGPARALAWSSSSVPRAQLVPQALIPLHAATSLPSTAQPGQAGDKVTHAWA